MKISVKLLILVCLALLEVSVSVWAVSQIPKTATVHQLYSLHLRSNGAFSGLVAEAEAAGRLETQVLREALEAVEAQPRWGLAWIGPVDRKVLSTIGTERVLELIQKDLEDAGRAHAALADFEAGRMDKDELLASLAHAAQEFRANSSRFEEPFTKTVAFLSQALVWFLLVFSCCCLGCIVLVCRSIRGSIRSLIMLLRSSPEARVDVDSLGPRFGGELQELLQVAMERFRGELMSPETNAELRQLIVDRTEALHAATQRAQESSEAKSRFLANLGHEIRTPMHGILCTAELLLEDLGPGDAHFERSSLIRDSATALLGFLNDFLDLSKLEAGKLILESRPLDLEESVGQVVALLQLQAQDKGIVVESSSLLGEDQGRVVGDPTRLRQILFILLANALESTEQGWVRCTLSATPLGPGKQALRMVVEDSGAGMTEQQLESLSGSLVQVDVSATRKYGGAGLGMALCMELSRLMGGNLAVESRPGQGTRCTVTLPLELAPAPVKKRATLASLTRDYGGAKVLLVEDNAVNQRVFCRMLERWNVQVVLAGHGQEALDLIREDIALVLMDVQMPVMDGLTATRELQERGWSKPIVALSANAFPEDRARFQESGMAGFVAKPVQADQLVAVLDLHLNGHRKRGSGPRGGDGSRDAA